MRALLVAAVLVVGLLAGCASDPTPTTTILAPPLERAERDPEWAVRAVFAGADPLATDHVPDHDHNNASLHKDLSSDNVQVRAHDGLASPYYEGATAGQAWCGDVSLVGERKIAVVHSFSSDVALSVIDVSDTTAPVLLSELVLPYVFTYDVAVFEDGKYAVIAGNPDLASDTSPAPAAGLGIPFEGRVRNACGADEPAQSNVDYIPYGYSAILVDLSDPLNPTVADFYEYPGGRNVHSISAATIDDTRYVATSGLGAVPCTVPGVTGAPALPVGVPCQPVPRYGNLLSHFDFLTVEETPAGARLLLHSVFTPTDQTGLDPSLLYLGNGHTDATLQKHPVTGQTVGYLADWDGGLHIVALTDLPQSEGNLHQVVNLATYGAAPGDDPTQMRGNIHSAVPVADLRDGRHYTLTGQEIIGRPTGRPTGQIVLLDTTAPNHPVPRARWTLPMDVMWPPSLGLTFSTHYPILVNDTLYVAMYHAGVWAADASQESWPDLPSLGVFIPDGEPIGEPRVGSPYPEVLQVLDAGDGSVFVFDGNSGIYNVHFDRTNADVVPAAPWPENPYLG